MISQKQMKEWIPEAVEQFKLQMPSVDAEYPEFHIVTDKTMGLVRAALLERTKSPAKIQGDIPAMETLHGPGGDAILIYQKRFSGSMWEEDAKEKFLHYIWHELGHFYVLSKENTADNFIRFMDQKPHPDEYESMIAYWFWSEFIAEVIACRIEPAAEIDWDSFSWYPTRNKLMGYLYGAFNTGDTRVSVYDLAFYFAKRLAEKTTVSFIEAARSGKLLTQELEWLRVKRRTFAEANIDPTGLDSVDDRFLAALMDLQEYLEIILSEEEYWRIDYEDLQTIGTIIYTMERIKTIDTVSARLKDRIFR